MCRLPLVQPDIVVRQQLRGCQSFITRVNESWGWFEEREKGIPCSSIRWIQSLGPHPLFGGKLLMNGWLPFFTLPLLSPLRWHPVLRLHFCFFLLTVSLTGSEGKRIVWEEAKLEANAMHTSATNGGEMMAGKREKEQKQVSCGDDAAAQKSLPINGNHIRRKIVVRQ